MSGSGCWLFSDSGIAYPLMPLPATNSTIVTVMNGLGITKLRYFAGSDSLPRFYYNGEPGPADNINQIFSTSETKILGPVLVVGAGDELGNHAGIERSDFFQDELWRDCSFWPIFANDGTVTIQLPVERQFFISDDVWQILWTTERRDFYSPCVSADGTKVVAPSDAFVQDKTETYRDGAVVYKCDWQKNPVVRMIILTIFRGMQTPRILAHFSREGLLVHCEVNCFGLSPVPDNGRILLEYAKDRGKCFELKQLKDE